MKLADYRCLLFSIFLPLLRLFSIICRKFLHVKNHPQQWAAAKSQNPWYQLKIKSGLRSKISFLLILRLSRASECVGFGIFLVFVICIFLRNERRRQTKRLWNVNENAGVGGWFLPFRGKLVKYECAPGKIYGGSPLEKLYREKYLPENLWNFDNFAARTLRELFKHENKVNWLWWIVKRSKRAKALKWIFGECEDFWNCFRQKANVTVS